jgi:hypothetical protein
MNGIQYLWHCQRNFTVAFNYRDAWSKNCKDFSSPHQDNLISKSL